MAVIFMCANAHCKTSSVLKYVLFRLVLQDWRTVGSFEKVSRHEFRFGQRLLNVLHGVRKRNAALFDRQRKVEDTSLNELKAVVSVQGRIMMLSGIVIVPGSVIHEIKAKSGPFAGEIKWHIERAED